MVSAICFYLQFQEIRQQQEKESKEKEEIHKQKKKQMEAEQKAEQKYQKWLRMKSHERSELERKEKAGPSVHLVLASSVLKMKCLH